jgi:hypothetical protein
MDPSLGALIGGVIFETVIASLIILNALNKPESALLRYGRLAFVMQVVAGTALVAFLIMLGIAAFATSFGGAGLYIIFAYVLLMANGLTMILLAIVSFFLYGYFQWADGSKKVPARKLSELPIQNLIGSILGIVIPLALFFYLDGFNNVYSAIMYSGHVN